MSCEGMYYSSSFLGHVLLLYPSCLQIPHIRLLLAGGAESCAVSDDTGLSRVDSGAGVPTLLDGLGTAGSGHVVSMSLSFGTKVPNLLEKTPLPFCRQASWWNNVRQIILLWGPFGFEEIYLDRWAS